MKEKKANVNSLLRVGKIEEAKEECKKRFSNPIYVSLYVKILMDEEKYDEAIEFCKKHLNYDSVLSQYITLLLMTDRYKEARKVIEEDLTREDLMSHYIRVLDYYKEDEKADDIYKNYPYNKYVSKAYANHLLKRHRFDEALKVCEKHMFDEEMVKLYDKISIIKNIYETDSSIKNKEINSNVEALRIKSDIMNLIKNQDYKQAKNMCRDYMDDDETIFELYLSILEKERMNGKKL